MSEGARDLISKVGLMLFESFIFHLFRLNVNRFRFCFKLVAAMLVNSILGLVQSFYNTNMN